MTLLSYNTKKGKSIWDKVQASELTTLDECYTKCSAIKEAAYELWHKDFLSASADITRKAHHFRVVSYNHQAFTLGWMERYSDGSVGVIYITPTKTYKVVRGDGYAG